MRTYRIYSVSPDGMRYIGEGKLVVPEYFDLTRTPVDFFQHFHDRIYDSYHPAFHLEGIFKNTIVDRALIDKICTHYAHIVHRGHPLANVEILEGLIRWLNQQYGNELFLEVVICEN